MDSLQGPCGHNDPLARAARVLEVDRVTLYNKIRKYELVKPANGG